MRSLNAKVYVKGYNWHDLDSFKIKFKIFDKYPVLKRQYYIKTIILNPMASQMIEMKAEHINEVAQLLARNFVKNNPIWKSFNLDQKQVFKFFVSELHLHLASQQITRKQINPNIVFDVVYVHQGKIIAAGFNLELHEYLKMANSTGESQTLKQFEVLEGYGKKLFEKVNLAELQKGKHVYGSFLVIDDNVSKQLKQSFRTKSLVALYGGFIKQGFKSLILRASNVRTQQIYLALGGKILSQVQFELKQQKFQLKLIQLEFNSPIFSQLIQPTL